MYNPRPFRNIRDGGAMYDKRLLNLAKEKGWKLPKNDIFPPAAWNRYWAAMEDYQRNPENGRPIPPHRSG